MTHHDRIQPRASAAARLLLLAALMSAPLAAQGALALQVQAPEIDGQTTILLHGFRDPGAPGIYFQVGAEIFASDTALEKGQKIVDAINSGDASSSFQAVIGSTAPVVVQIQGARGYQLSGATRIIRDDTGGGMAVHLQTPPRSQTADIISFAGVATGVDLGGMMGGVAVQVGGCNVFVPTYAGQSASDVENAVCAQLGNCGLTAWIATPDETLAGVQAISSSGGGGVFVLGGPGQDILAVSTRDAGLWIDTQGTCDPMEPGRAWLRGTRRGDCGGDGQVGITDALKMARIGTALDPSPPAGSERFDACNVAGQIAPDPGATVDILDALALAQELVQAPAPVSCPGCDIPPEWLTPPPTPAGYRYVGRSVVVDFVLVETTEPLTRPLRETDITHIRSKTIVMGLETCCDVIVSHTFERITP